jgi:YHS domain-containing protein
MEQFDKDPKEYVNKPAAPLPAESPMPSADLKQPGQGEEHQLAKDLRTDGKAHLPEILNETPVTDKDPVCGMKLGEEVVRSLAYKSAYQGKLYYFCSDECKREFDRDSEHYASQAASGPAPAASNPAPSPTAGMDMSKPDAQPVAPGPITPPGTGKEMSTMVKDPVCGQEFVKSATRGLKHKSVYQTKTYFLCSQHCKQEFDKDPNRYLNKTAAGALIPQEPLQSILPGRDGKFRGGRIVTPKSVPPPVIPQGGDHQHD